MAPWGFWHLNHWGRGEPDLHYLFLNDNVFALMPWMVKQQKTTHKGKRIASCRISRGRRVVKNAFGKISEQVQGTTGHHGAKAKGCQRHYFYMCGVAQHAGDTPGWSRQGPSSSNCRNPSREAKCQ